MLDYKFFIQNEESSKPEILAESQEQIYQVKGKDKLLDRLRKLDRYEPRLTINEETFNLVECFVVSVNVKDVGAFNFVYRNKEFDLEDLKNRLLTLKDLSVKTDELRKQKIHAMLEIVLSFNPFMGYYNDYSADILDYPLPENFLFIMKVDPKDKEEKAFKEKENNYTDTLISFVIPLLSIVAFYVMLEMFSKSNMFGLILVIVSIIEFAFMIYFAYDSAKDKKSGQIFSLKRKFWYLFNAIGTAAGVLISWLLGQFALSHEGSGANLTFLFISLGYGILVVILGYIIGAVAYRVIAKIIAKKNGQLETKESNVEEKSHINKVEHKKNKNDNNDYSSLDL